MRVRNVLVVVGIASLVTLTLTATALAQSFRPEVEPTVQRVRASYPALVTPDQVGEILNAIAWQHRPNIKLLKKAGGGKCPSPQGETISCDILIWAPPGTTAEQTLHIDVLSGASGEGLVPASAFWKSAGPCTKRSASHPQGGSGCEMKNALEPIAVGDEDPPDPTPTPQTPPVPTTDLKAYLEKVLEAYLDLHEQVVDLRARLEAFRHAFDLYAERPPLPVELPQIPCMEGVFLRQNVRICPDVP